MLLTFLIGLAHGGEGASQLYQRAVTLIDRHYLRLQDFSLREALLGAANAAEAEIPWLIAEPHPTGVTLFHGEKGQLATVALQGDTPEDLIEGLRQLEAVIAKHGVADDVELPIVLLRGVTQALDDHSMVLADRRLERFDERIKGKLTGIGCRIGTDDAGLLLIKDVFFGGPAAGVLQADDVVVQIDGESTLGMSVRQAVERIRGPEDSAVVLGVRRGERTLEVDIVRAEVVVPNVSWRRLPSGVGIIEVDHFSEQTVEFMRQALVDFELEGITGLVVDLRGNSGGSMIQSAESADLFVEEGTLLRTVGRDGGPVANLRSVMMADSQGIEPQVPVVVLVDGRSASASEILAGTLSLLERAVIVGQRTYGKGTVQKVYTLERGRARLKLTVAEYRLPGEVTVTDEGIGPDLELNPVRFGTLGVDFVGEASPLAVDYVVEETGWRGEETLESMDFGLQVAERVLLLSEGFHRQDLLVAVETVRELTQAEQKQAIADLLAARGLDWSPGVAPAEVRLQADLLLVDAPIAGSLVETRISVKNLSDSPLHQVMVRLTSQSGRGPWHGVELPVGRIAVGETGLGKRVVRLPMREFDQDDVLEMTVLCDGCDPMGLPSTMVTSRGNPRPPLAVTAEHVAVGERVQLHLKNEGERMLTGVRVRFEHPGIDGVALLDSEARLPVLSPGSRERVDLGVALDGLDRETLPLVLRVESEQFSGRWGYQVPLDLPVDGDPVYVEPPRLVVNMPSNPQPGTHDVTVRAVDDVGLSSLTVWVDGEKVVWREGEGRRMQVRVPLVVNRAHHELVVRALDSHGVSETQRYTVRAPVDDATAEVPEEVGSE